MARLPNKVLVVEDDAEVRSVICASIAIDPDLVVCGEAGTIAEAMSLLESGFPDIALIDLGLPDGPGQTIIAWLHTHAPSVKTLVLSVFGDERHVISAIQSGALGYLLKSDNAENLSSNIKLVLNGNSPISPAVARHILKASRNSRPLKLSPSSAEKPDSTPSEPKIPVLTPTETEILNHIAKGFTAPEIAAKTGKSVNTVPVHIKNIYRKLSVHNRGEAVYEGMQLGIIGSELP